MPYSILFTSQRLTLSCVSKDGLVNITCCDPFQSLDWVPHDARIKVVYNVQAEITESRNYYQSAVL